MSVTFSGTVKVPILNGLYFGPDIEFLGSSLILSLEMEPAFPLLEGIGDRRPPRNRFLVCQVLCHERLSWSCLGMDNWVNLLPYVTDSSNKSTVPELSIPHE